MAIVGVPDNAVPTSFKFLIPFVQHQVRSPGRQGAAWRGPLFGRADQAAFEPARLQKSTDTFHRALIPQSLGECSQQLIVVHPGKARLQVKIHHPAIARGDLRLGLCHRLVC
jgi:hypothetical protein